MAAVSPDGRPVAVFESIAPQGRAYPMVGVLVLLGVAVGLPFLVVSTSAPLLQRWFVYTGHPAAQDPYFLYAASNAGSLLTLVGYPLLIEPGLSVKTQTWVWAGGFALLTGLVYLCGKAVADPSGSAAAVGGQAVAARQATVRTPPPPLSDRVRWAALAFVPSSLMLGVTFHMTTDIASVPLLWVIPLALYLLTFIIAFARTPGWFRPVLSNVAPVMILLLVFVMTLRDRRGERVHEPGPAPGHVLRHGPADAHRAGPTAAGPGPPDRVLPADLGRRGARRGVQRPDRPGRVPAGLGIPDRPGRGLPARPAAGHARGRPGRGRGARTTPGRRGSYFGRFPAWMFDVLVPLAMFALAGGLAVLPGKAAWFRAVTAWTAGTVTTGLQNCGVEAYVSAGTITTLVLFAVPCMLCFLFIDRPVRFGLCVAAVLFAAHLRAVRSDPAILRERSFFGILKVTQDADEFPSMNGFQGYTPDELWQAWPSLNFTGTTPDGEPDAVLFDQKVAYRKLYHGTTLHGQQAVGRSFSEPFTDLRARRYMARRSQREWLAEAVLRDDVRLFGAVTAWDAVLLAGARTGWDFRQEPLTYYHRTGPVGEIFAEARRRHAAGDVGMIGLGTGSVAAYARPGQSLTFYEIDPTVLDIVEVPRVMNPAEVAAGKPADMGPFTFIADARDRGAEVDFVLGDARLKLQENDDVRYDLLLVDAFSSDAIPVHLLTREAMALYKDRIADDGLLAVHISNRYINLAPVVAVLAAEAGLAGRIWNDSDDDYPGKTASSWIVLAKSEAALGGLGSYRADTGFHALAGSAAWFTLVPWQPLVVDPNVTAWTDDYSDVLRVITLDEIRAVRRALGLPIAGGPE